MLECGGSLVSRDGEVFCRRCGLVWSVENVAESLPFSEDSEDDGGAVKCFEGHWQHGKRLAFLRGLGDAALANSRGKVLMRVLAKSLNGATDLGLRATQIRALVK
jgi:hypothetical protein